MPPVQDRSAVVCEASRHLIEEARELIGVARQVVARSRSNMRAMRAVLYEREQARREVFVQRK